MTPPTLLKWTDLNNKYAYTGNPTALIIEVSGNPPRLRSLPKLTKKKPTANVPTIPVIGNPVRTSLKARRGPTTKIRNSRTLRIASSLQFGNSCARFLLQPSRNSAKLQYILQVTASGA